MARKALDPEEKKRRRKETTKRYYKRHRAQILQRISAKAQSKKYIEPPSNDGRRQKEVSVAEYDASRSLQVAPLKDPRDKVEPHYHPLLSPTKQEGRPLLIWRLKPAKIGQFTKTEPVRDGKLIDQVRL